MRIELNDVAGNTLYSHTCEDNTIKITLEKAVKEEVDLTGIKLSEVNLTCLYLRGAKFKDADLWGCNLSGSDLRDADLRNTNLCNAKMNACLLLNADLSNSLATNISLNGANFEGANLKNIGLCMATLSNCKKLHYATCSFSGLGEEESRLNCVVINGEPMFFDENYKGTEEQFLAFIKNDSFVSTDKDTGVSILEAKLFALDFCKKAIKRFKTVENKYWAYID